MKRQWKPIRFKYRLYFISNLGEVYSERSGKLLKLHPNKKGYLCVRLWDMYVSYNYAVHSLVMLYFAGPTPKGMEIDHIDKVRTNNRLTNLRFLPLTDNRAKGEDHGMVKLTEQEVEDIRQEYSHSTISHRRLAKKYNVGKSQITRILNYESWI